MNRLSHGLTAETAVLPGESDAEYEHLRTDMLAAHQPEGAHETMLVEELAHAYWRLLRLHRVENHFWNYIGGHHNRGEAGIAEALVQEKDVHFRAFFRYYAQIERSYHKALAAVNQIKPNRRPAQAPEPADLQLTPAPSPRAAHHSPSNSPLGTLATSHQPLATSNPPTR